MGGDGVTLYNQTTGDVVDNDQWMDSVVTIKDINCLAHQFFWQPTDKLISIRDGGFYFKHYFDAQTNSIVTDYLGDDYESDDSKSDSKADSTDHRSIIDVSQNITVHYNKDGYVLEVVRYVNGDKYVSKIPLCSSQSSQSPQLISDHYPNWTNFGNCKVCLDCLEIDKRTVELTQHGRYSYSFTAKPEVTTANLDSMLKLKPRVIMNGKLVEDQAEACEYVIVAALSHALAKYNSPSARSSRDPLLVDQINSLIDKHCIASDNERLYRYLIYELRSWLGGGDQKTTTAWLVSEVDYETAVANYKSQAVC